MFVTPRNPHTSMERRWRHGDELDLNGLRWRVVRGRKSDSDLRLDVDISAGMGQWKPIGMDMVAMQVDFLCENEDFLYPPPRQGGRMLFDLLADAHAYGFRRAFDDNVEAFR